MMGERVRFGGTRMSGSEEDRLATPADCCTQPSSSSSSPEDHVTMTTSPPTPGTPTQATSSPILIPVERLRSSRGGSDSGVSVGSFSPRHCHICNSPRAYSPTVFPGPRAYSPTVPYSPTMFVFPPSPSTARCRGYSPSRTQGTQTPSPLCQVALQITEEGATGGGEVCRRPRNMRRVQSSVVFRTRYHSESDSPGPTSPASAGDDQMASDPLPDLLQFRARSRSEPVRVSPEELVARELRRISDEFDSLMFGPAQRRSNGSDRPASFGGRDLQEREQGQDWWSYVMAVFRSKSADNVVPPRHKRGDDADRGDDDDGSTTA
ncbi:uncharacterized protein [Branchiostoma lanceolatum]|uniref:uncharacterized protein isoform X2 n=1 Tax=Branchiostoma lanceolatum TaxID=7740 RepID=UPI0034550506